ncbi:MAG: enoyl-CoA hydratase/isomerase family protein [Deltaproteobacteria bacterium]|nr:enoyl-CoA hydratase/isomerase family protein [Deltaproteobacteria bacterium]
MGYGNILLEFEGPLAILSVNRPRRLNALNTQTLGELLSAVGELASRAEIRVVILTGAGDKSFIAGADVTEMVDKSHLEALRFAELGQNVCSAFEHLDRPVIAAINGYALGGGCELAMACDFAYASTEATIGQPEVNLGIIPGFGGTQRLLRRVAPGLARELVFTGRAIGADEALRLGLVNAVYPPTQLMPRVRETALQIVEKGPLAIARAKSLMVAGFEMSLSAASVLEREAFAGLFASHDQKEGMRAFLEKRPPTFQGK